MKQNERFPLRVCFVSSGASLGGAERALLELLLALRMMHIESFVVLPSTGQMLVELKRLGIPWTIIRYDWWMGAKTTLSKRFEKILRGGVGAIPLLLRLYRWKIDLVCTNSIPTFTGALAAWIGRKPHVWFIHEFVEQTYGLTSYLPLSLVMRLVTVLSRAILASSEATRRGYACYLPQEKVHVAYQAALYEVPTSSPSLVPFEKSSKARCVSVGALTPGKGHSDAIRAVGMLGRSGLEVQLAIIGSGDFRPSLEALVEEEGLRRCVFFTGFHPNPSHVMEAADIVLVCSRNEGFGRVAVEAMRLGKPVIAAASGGTLELIRDGVNGLLYEPGNFEQLAQKIELLLQSRSLRSKLAQNGAKSAEHFSLEAYGTAVLTHFRQALRKDLDDREG